MFDRWLNLGRRRAAKTSLKLRSLTGVSDSLTGAVGALGVRHEIMKAFGGVSFYRERDK